jgi:DNA-binding transcriptional LysR family regulator
MLDPRRLLIFEAVVRAGSFSAAAARLHLSQPSVSRHVAALEQDCRLPLLRRTHRALQLTSEGAAVLERAAAIRAELAALDATVEAFARGEAGAVRIASFPTAATALVAPALARLRKLHPGFEATVREASRLPSLAMLRGRDADLALVFDLTGDEPDDMGGLASRALIEEQFLLALPRRHRLASQARVSLRRLRNEGWIVGTATDTPGAIARACLADGFAPRIVAAVDDQPTIQALVAAGVGVTLIPQLAAARVRNDLVLRPLQDEGLTRRIWAVSLDITPRLPAVAAVLEELVRAGTAFKRRG